MKQNTRYVLFVGVGILALGLIAGGVAYLQGGFPALAVAQSGPDALQYVPADASLVAYANVRDVMVSNFRDQFRQFQPGDNGQREFRDQTGIDIEQDIDSVVAGLVPEGETASGLLLLTGRFDAERLESLASQYGGTTAEYSGRRVFTRVENESELSMSFLEADVLAVGSTPMVRRAIDLSAGSDAQSVTTNDRLMGLMTHVRGSDNAWAVADFEAANAMTYLPEEVRSQIPPVAAMAIGGRVNGGVSASLTMEASDEQAGQDLHAVVQGFVALARLQTGSRPELQGVLDSVRLLQSGNAVTLAFDLPPEILELAVPTPQDVPQ